MNDRELEARLRAHLHRSLDHLAAPGELRASVELAMRTPARRVFASGVRFRPGPQLGFTLVAAAVVVVLVVASNLISGPSPSGPGSSPSSSPALSSRTFIVLPPGTAVPSKADAEVASDVLAARLRALGVGTFTSSGGYGITFDLADTLGRSDDLIRAVLAAPGEVEFVPLPAADYGTMESPGPLSAEVGKPLPKAEPALFGRDGIASILSTASSTQGLPELDIVLRSPAAMAFADYTTAHIGEFFAMLIDGKVGLVPTIREPITGGEIAIGLTTIAGDGGSPRASDADAVAAAILVGGALPASWRGASVPTVISRDEADTAATAATSGGTPYETELNAELIGGAWRAVWNVAVTNPGCSDLGSCPYTSLAVKIDAVSGTVIVVAAPSP